MLSFSVLNSSKTPSYCFVCVCQIRKEHQQTIVKGSHSDGVCVCVCVCLSVYSRNAVYPAKGLQTLRYTPSRLPPAAADTERSWAGQVTVIDTTSLDVSVCVCTLSLCVCVPMYELVCVCMCVSEGMQILGKHVFMFVGVCMCATIICMRLLSCTCVCVVIGYSIVQTLCEHFSQ